MYTMCMRGPDSSEGRPPVTTEAGLYITVPYCAFCLKVTTGSKLSAPESLFKRDGSPRTCACGEPATAIVGRTISFGRGRVL
jgi:hypothetical protein